MTRSLDQQLLREFAGSGDERPFTLLVQRYLPLVHSTARRHLGDAGLAEDVSQQVFVLLARKAGELTDGIVLSGWLYQTTRHVARHFARAEQRRRLREHHAMAAMTQEAPDAVWRAIESELDDAMESLGAVDRDAILLRYFENRSLRDVGQALGFTEAAIQKRLSRAVEKLRAYFHRRGRVIGTASLVAALSGFAVVPVPAAMAGGISAAVLQTSTLVPSTLTITTMKPFILTPLLKPALLGVAGLTAVMAWLGEHQKVSAERLRTQALETRLAELEVAAVQPAAAGSSTLARLTEADRLELAQLRGEVKRLRHQLERANAALAQPRSAQPPAPIADASTPTATVLDPKRLQDQIEVLKHVGLGLRILCSEPEAESKYKSLQFGTGNGFPKDYQHLLGPVASSLDQIELLVPDIAWALKAEAMPEAIVARAREALPTPDGHFIRAYVLGDGSVQSIRHATADEAYGWGQFADGRTVDWNVGQSSVVLDPDLARRYGLKVGDK